MEDQLEALDIIFIDDNEKDRDLAEAIINKSSYQLASYNDPKEASEVINSYLNNLNNYKEDIIIIADFKYEKNSLLGFNEEIDLDKLMNRGNIILHTAFEKEAVISDIQRYENIEIDEDDVNYMLKDSYYELLDRVDQFFQE